MAIQNAINASTARPTLVFGATGRQGGAVARTAIGKGGSVRALVRDPASVAARALSAYGVEVVRGDYSDPASIRAAMKGIDRVFSTQPNSGSAGSGLTDADEVRYAKLVADLAVEAGVGHLVYSSASIISQGPTGVPNLDCKIEIEDHVRRLSIPWTIVRPSTFMELLATPDFWPRPDLLHFFAGSKDPVEFIATEDIGKIVGAILERGDRFAARTVNIAGDLLDGEKIQTAIGKELGQPITFARFPDTLLEQHPMLQRTVQLFAAGRGAGNADLTALEHEFGRLTRLEDWLSGTGGALLCSVRGS
ncbi:NmrA/HSCARG family protein [Sphingomonas sp.]|uniref:NmrA/HSCARG family protein n=1 Tax=Sphingomonas sp. TaxID=28214 RepID=UPI002BEBE66C|nr:NmrA/HSCARG family protein [Sphingomonas sp.]HTG39028.1 NmrA/HSCARG family protein [Sphingomonas sp.]